jgi:hypothetical protein
VTRDLIVEVATDRDIDAIVKLERRGWPKPGRCRRIGIGSAAGSRSAA